MQVKRLMWSYFNVKIISIIWNRLTFSATHMLRDNSQCKRETIVEGRALIIYHVRGKGFILLLNENIKVGGQAFSLKTYTFLK